MDIRQLNLGSWVEKGLPVLNEALYQLIPFNAPHKIQVAEFQKNNIKTLLPYIPENFNHIRGLHAGALMTLSEFTSGLLLLSRLSPSEYRLIMQKIEVSYFYQGKGDAYGYFSVTEEALASLIETLERDQSAVFPCEVQVKDESGALLCTAMVHWHLKPWKFVKTEL